MIPETDPLDETETCPACKTVIPEGTAECPGCKVGLVFCFLPSCFKPYPHEDRYCPFCGTPNELAKLPAAPEEAGGFPEEGRGAKGEAPSPMADPVAPANPAPLHDLNSSSIGPLLAQLAAWGSASLPPVLSQQPATRNPAPPPAVATAPGLPAEQARPMADGLPGLIAPVVFEIEMSQPPRRDQQGLLRLRATGQGVQGEAAVEVAVSSSFWPVPKALSARLAPDETHEFPGLAYIARVAGTHEVRLAVTLRDLDDVPIGRWTASWVLTIEAIAKEQAAPISATGDVFIFGGGPNPGPPNLWEGLPRMPATWDALVLRPDRAFWGWLSRTCPETAARCPAPPSAGRPAGAGGSAHFLVELSDQQTRQIRVMAVVCGATASFGRGGDPGVAWWIKPDPYEEH